MQYKRPINEQGERHGLWETYYTTGELMYKGNFIHGIRFGKHEHYTYEGKLFCIINYINGNLYGYYESNYEKIYCAM